MCRGELRDEGEADTGARDFLVCVAAIEQLENGFTLSRRNAAARVVHCD